jgi:hypothetical protein
MMTIGDRYLHDPVFHNLVDLIFSQIEAGKFTATELRDAAMLAAIMYDERRIVPIWRKKLYEEGK